MIAYKFLRSGRIGPFSAFRWPEPGVWVHAQRDLVACQRGIHACRPSDLPWWLADELWEIELDGDVRGGRAQDHRPGRAVGLADRGVDPGVRSGVRGRVRVACPGASVTGPHARRQPARGPPPFATCATLDEVLAAARQLAADIPKARISLTIAGDGAVRALTGAPPTSAYIAAHAAMRLDGVPGYAAERAWQSRWLVGRLGLNYLRSER